MRVNTGQNKSKGTFLFDIIEIKYALLRCLRYTSQTSELSEMLLYVLLCSAVLNQKSPKKHSLYILIDNIVEIIGADYVNCQKYPPAEIFGSLDKNTRRVLFRCMTNSHVEIQEEKHFDGLSTELNIAKQELKCRMNMK